MNVGWGQISWLGDPLGIFHVNLTCWLPWSVQWQWGFSCARRWAEGQWSPPRCIGWSLDKEKERRGDNEFWSEQVVYQLLCSDKEENPKLEMLKDFQCKPWHVWGGLNSTSECLANKETYLSLGMQQNSAYWRLARFASDGDRHGDLSETQGPAGRHQTQPVLSGGHIPCNNERFLQVESSSQSED